jgi:hypothetical protein
MQVSRTTRALLPALLRLLSGDWQADDDVDVFLKRTSTTDAFLSMTASTGDLIVQRSQSITAWGEWILSAKLVRE